MVASSVMVGVRPTFVLTPTAPLSLVVQRSGALLSCLFENVAVGITSRGGRGRSSGTTSSAFFSNTHLPGSSGGQATDTPMRLTRRQNRMPMRRFSPPLKRMLWSGSRISTV